MQWFDPHSRIRSSKHRKIYAYYTLAYTLIDFLAAVMFITGSVFFFDEATVYAATWLFLIGSIFFALRPTTTLLRELALIRAGDYVDVVKR